MATESVCSVSYIDHVGVAVKDINAALKFFQEVFGAPPAEIESLPDQGVRATLIQVGQTRLELLEPLSDGSPVGRFVERRACSFVARGCASLSYLTCRGFVWVV